MRKKLEIAVLVASLIICAGNVVAEEIRSVAVIPFAVHSKESAMELGGLWQEALKENLGKSELIKVYDVRDVDIAERPTSTGSSEIEAARETGADFAVTGSLTRLGDTISADARVVDIRGAASYGVAVQGRFSDGVDSLAVKFTKDVLLKVLDDQRISKFVFRGNERIEDSAVVKVLTSKKGELVSKEHIASDIKTIYKMGFFRDVKADVEDGPEGKIVTYSLKEMPLLSDFSIEGNDELDKEDIEGVITLEDRKMLDPNEVQMNVENIKELYRKEGYLNTEVDYAVEDIDDKTARVVFKINENARVYIKKISITGNKAYTDDVLREMMETSEWGLFHFITDSGLLDEDKLKQDIEKLTAFYYNNGYIKAQIGEPDISHDKKWIYVEIPVIEGRQFRVGEISIVGDEVSTARTELLEKLNIAQKDYFDRNAIVKDIDYLTQVCNNEGYAYANVTPKTTPREKDQLVDVSYSITKGNLIFVNRISISGNTKTRDKVIRRQLSIVEGDLSNRDKMRSSYMKLNRLRYFEEINFQSEKGPEDDLMDINIGIKEKSTGMISIGAGYSATDHAMLMAQVSQQNLFGRGQTLSLKGNFSASTQRYDVSFEEPWLFDIPLWSKFNLWNTVSEYDSYDLDAKGIGFSLGYPLFEHVRGYLSYAFEDNKVSDVQSTASNYIKSQEGQIASSGVTLEVRRDTTDDFMFPSKGSRNSVSVEHTGTLFMGDTSFTKYYGKTMWYFPLPLDNVFSVRGRIGFIQANEGKEIPVYERFYLGGMNSLRGLREVGPKDSSGDTIGGETMLNFNAEFVFPLLKDAGMKGVIFFDTGNSWESGYHPGDMRETAGIGLRWYSPIGPLRFEWGHVLDKKDGEKSSRFEFSIGMFM